MKTIKFLLQALLIATSLIFTSCSSDDGFDIPTPENSDILLSEYKIAYDASGYYHGVSFIYNSNNELEEAAIYDYNASTKTKRYTNKYIFETKTNNKKEVNAYYITSETGSDTWNIDYTTILHYNNKGKITKMEDFRGSVDIDIMWKGNRIIKTMSKDNPHYADSAQYHKGNYMDFSALKQEGETWDYSSKTTTTFSTYANYWQMIPVELYLFESKWLLGQLCDLGAYFSDNAISKKENVIEIKSYTDYNKTTLYETSLTTIVTNHDLTFGIMSQKVPAKVVMTPKTVAKTTDRIALSSNHESKSIGTSMTIMFTYIKK